MAPSPVPLGKRMTLVPLRHMARTTREARVLDDPPVTVENVSGFFTVKDLDLWRDMVPRNDREELASVEYALVHRFHSPGHMGRGEADSELLLRRVFLCLRIVQPVMMRFRSVQLLEGDDGREVLGFRGPEGVLNPLDSDVWREVGPQELELFREVLPRFILLADGPPSHLTRAVNIFHEGYFFTAMPAVQLVVWCMGVDVCLSHARPLNRRAWMDHLYERVPPETDVYSDLPWDEVVNPRPRLSVRDVAGDLFDFRNTLVHGLWDQVPKSAIQRQTLSGTDLRAADVLREAASFLLRRLLLDEFRKV